MPLAENIVSHEVTRALAVAVIDDLAIAGRKFIAHRLVFTAGPFVSVLVPPGPTAATWKV